MTPLPLFLGSLDWRQFAVALFSAFGAGALVFAASCWDRKNPPSDATHSFPIRLSRLLRRSALVAAGAGLAACAAQMLFAHPAITWSEWPQWIGFLSASALVLSVLHRWPAPLIFDREGVLLRGNRSSRIRWEDLSHIRKYRLHGRQGIVIHDICGKQLHVPGEDYEYDKVREALASAHHAPIQSPGVALNLPMPLIRIRPTPPRR